MSKLIRSIWFLWLLGALLGVQAVTAHCCPKTLIGPIEQTEPRFVCDGIWLPALDYDFASVSSIASDKKPILGYDRRALLVANQEQNRTAGASGLSAKLAQFLAADTGLSVQLSQKGLDLVGNHLAQFGDDAANAGMMQNLQDAFAAGENVTGANANFYLHEASEATFMQNGLSYDAAHAAALQKYGVSPYSLYAPNVIQANPTLFNNAWRAAAGLPPNP